MAETAEIAKNNHIKIINNLGVLKRKIQYAYKTQLKTYHNQDVWSLKCWILQIICSLVHKYSMR